MASEEPDLGEVHGYVPTETDWAIYHAWEVECRRDSTLAEEYALPVEEIREIHERMKRFVAIERDRRHESLRLDVARLEHQRALCLRAWDRRADPPPYTQVTRTIEEVNGKLKRKVVVKTVARESTQENRQLAKLITKLDKSIAKLKAELAAYERELTQRTPAERVAAELKAYGRTFEERLDEALFRDVKSLDAEIERELQQEEWEQERRRRAREEN